MKGAIFYATKYGSTAEYARWIHEATGLPLLNIDETDEDPGDYDFLVVGGSIIYFKLINRRWIARHADVIMRKPTILFTVSGAGPGPKLEGWLAKCLPAGMTSHVDHVALRGRQNPRDLNWFDRVMLLIAGFFNRDRKAAKEEAEGFDYMHKNSIAPIVKKIWAIQAMPNAVRSTAADQRPAVS